MPQLKSRVETPRRKRSKCIWLKWDWYGNSKLKQTDMGFNSRLGSIDLMNNYTIKARVL
jgi:hypothetical protein